MSINLGPDRLAFEPIGAYRSCLTLRQPFAHPDSLEVLEANGKTLASSNNADHLAVGGSALCEAAVIFGGVPEYGSYLEDLIRTGAQALNDAKRIYTVRFEGGNKQTLNLMLGTEARLLSVGLHNALAMGEITQFDRNRHAEAQMLLLKKALTLFISGHKNNIIQSGAKGFFNERLVERIISLGDGPDELTFISPARADIGLYSRSGINGSPRLPYDIIHLSGLNGVSLESLRTYPIEVKTTPQPHDNWLYTNNKEPNSVRLADFNQEVAQVLGTSDLEGLFNIIRKPEGHLDTLMEIRESLLLPRSKQSSVAA